MPFKFRELAIPGVVLIEPLVFSDDRGFFMEAYKYSDFAANGIPDRFVQENRSRSKQGVLRGLHFQREPRAQGKLVYAAIGKLLDIAVDIRSGSPTYGKWVKAELSDENKRMVYLPPWCAHGFLILSDVAEIVYKATNEYAPEQEGGIIWNDPDLGISWPITHPILSTKDQRWPRLGKADHNFTWQATADG